MAESSPRPDPVHDSDIDDSGSDSDSSSDSGGLDNPEEKLQRAAASKDSGNAAFQRQEWAEARTAYEQGIKLLEPFKNAGPAAVTDAQRDEIRRLLCTLHANKAMVLLKLEDWAGAAKASTAALKIDGSNTKALFRRGVAYSQSGRLDEAKADLLQVLNLDPANAAAKKELAAVQKKLQEQRQKEKQSFAGLFERSSGMYEDKEQERLQKERQEEERKLKEEDDWRKDNIRRRDLGQSEQTFEEWKKQKEEDARKREEQRRKKVNSGPAARKATTKRSPASSSNSDDEYDEEEKQIINETKQKGYCYFRRQQSEEEKQLFANNAPQKVDAPGAESAGNTVAEAKPSEKPARPAGGSAWNFAGTFEERDMTSWAKDRLKQLCLEAAVTDEGVDVQNDPESLAKAMENLDPSADPAAGMQQLTDLSAKFARIEAKVTSVKKLDGDAQIAVVRGTNRYLFDFNLQLDFEVKVDERAPAADGGDPPAKKKFRGTLNFEELSNTTAENEWECHITWKTSPSPLYRARVQKVTDMLRHSVFQKVEEFAQEYQRL